MSSQAESGSSVDRTSHLLTEVTKVFEGHTNLVRCVAYFPDGRRIASGSEDKTIRIWNVESGKQEGETLEHDSEVRAMAISPDGEKIAARVAGSLIVWDVVRRERVREVNIDSGSERSAHTLVVAFSPDGRLIATASSGSTSIHVWDVETGSPVKELQQHVDTVRCSSFSPGGARIATGSDVGSFRVLEVSTGKTVVGPIHGHKVGLSSLAHLQGGRLLITASYDGNVRVWDTEMGQEVGRPMLLSRSAIQSIAISADGKRIASASLGGSVPLWNLGTRQRVRDLFASRTCDWIFCVEFSPNGRFIIGGGSRDVWLWDTAAVLDSPPSPPTTSKREPSRSVLPSVHLTTHPSPPFIQQKQTPSKAHRDTSSLSSSILDLPAVVQPKPERLKEAERPPSIDDWDSVRSHRRPTNEPNETQQELQTKRENLNTSPSAAESDNQWTRIIRHYWRHFRSRKLRAHVETPQDSPPKEERHSRTVPPVTSGGWWLRTIHQNKCIKRTMEDQADIESLVAQKLPPTRFWNRLRRSGAPSVKSAPRGQKQPTSGVVDVAGGRDKVRLIMSPDTERYGVPPPEPVELPPIASRPPSFFEIEVDPLEGWSWSRELRELICCYWCFPRNRRPV